MVYLGSEFKQACNGVNTVWFPGCIKIRHGETVFLGILFGILSILFGILSIVLGIFFTF